MTAAYEFVGVRDQAVEPAQFVIEFRSRPRIAVGQIQAGHDEPVHGGLQVTALIVAAIAWKRPAALDRIRVAGEDGHAIPRPLSAP
ncbi:hypothetical protein D3C71_2051440 [compost metagenome]